MRRHLVWLCTALQILQRFGITCRVAIVDLGDKQVGNPFSVGRLLRSCGPAHCSDGRRLPHTQIARLRGFKGSTADIAHVVARRPGSFWPLTGHPSRKGHRGWLLTQQCLLFGTRQFPTGQPTSQKQSSQRTEGCHLGDRVGSDSRSPIFSRRSVPCLAFLGGSVDL